MIPIFLKSQKNNDLKIHDTFIYNYEQEIDGNKKFRCPNRSCRSKFYYYQNNTFKTDPIHNHVADKKKCARKLSASRIKNSALDSRSNTSTIITEMTNEMSDDEIKLLQYEKS
ncbi:hypothetical protein DMUE_1053 [Dictyocoela muelleri]|nr:hypothetical protein DMUE_1053 [Dictyocoela muelleri]